MKIPQRSGIQRTSEGPVEEKFKAGDQRGWATRWSPDCGQGLEGPLWKQIHPSLRWVWKLHSNPFNLARADSYTSIHQRPAHTLSPRSEGLGGICAVWELLRSAFQGKRPAKPQNQPCAHPDVVSHFPPLHKKYGYSTALWRTGEMAFRGYCTSLFDIMKGLLYFLHGNRLEM